ncbi:acyltransferase family protein [Sphingomonas sp.]|uniref:acyltransferase family protein n=1 Tax=Sphingomonas sp. TaxID=28214 RepID=UPI002ED9BA6B
MASQPLQRLEGLDIFRGLAVAGMIIVNTPGSGEHVWWPLDHAEWHGFTPTDLVFPAFLCAMGAALGLSFPRKVDAALWRRVAWRTAALIGIGWAWQLLVRPELANLRVFGVFPRLGLCYGIAATIAILTARRGADGRAELHLWAIAGAAGAALIFYWAAMALGGDFTRGGNLAGYVDRTLVGTQHIWRFGRDEAGNVVYDPEGLFSTIPALANVLLGAVAALTWKRDPARALRWIAIGGVTLIAMGLAMHPWFPLNKKLWTSSFALLTSGLSALLLVLCVLAGRAPAIRAALTPFQVFGMNAILGYILSLLIGLAGMRLGFQRAGYEAALSVLRYPYLASFLYSLAVALLVFMALAPLHRRGIHLRL